MAALLWDASALAKRYLTEAGTASVDALFDAAPRPEMVGTTLGYAETYSTILRHGNRGALSADTLGDAKSLLRGEVLIDPAFKLLTVDDNSILSGIAFMERYNINATDAAILSVFLRHVAGLTAPITTHVLVASDRRLLAAAAAEGLTTFNPESVRAAQVPSFLAAF